MNGRAEALAGLGREKEALAELDALLAGHPDFAVGWWTKAAILARRGDREQARELAEQALRLATPAVATEIRADPALAGLLPSTNQSR